MKKINILTILLAAGILLVVNVLSQYFSHPFDFSEGQQHTLSNATKDILKSLEDPVTVTAFFSKDLPPNLLELRKNFRDMLDNYQSASRGMVDFRFVTPNDSLKQAEALQNGIRPVMINVREKDQSKQQKAFLGAVLKLGEQTETIPLIASSSGLEYTLSTSIKKMAAVKKPFVGIVQGHGEPSLQELGQVYQALEILYTVEPVDLGTPDLSKFKAIALVAPRDSLPALHLANLDNYLAGGGNLLLAVNRVNGDMQTQSGTVVNTGLETWLQSKGINVEPAFIIDAQCGTVTVQQQQGFFMINTPVQFPYLPLIKEFPEHLVTEGIEQVILPFASPVSYTGSGEFTPILYSSERSASSPAPTNFDVINRQWTAADFPQSQITIGGIISGETPGRMVVFGDGDFPVSGQGRGQSKDNISLLVNSIDFLSDDTGLIELRTKGITTRPIDDDFLGDENQLKRNLVKYLTFGIPILLVVLLGIVVTQRQRSIRKRRMSEDYS